MASITHSNAKVQDRGKLKYVTRFEDEVRQLTGAKYAVAVSSGTATLHVAILLAEVAPGDEVITQPLTFRDLCIAEEGRRHVAYRNKPNSR